MKPSQPSWNGSGTGAPAASPAERRLRVAAYCRVSTDLTAQENSLDLQRSHYRRLIEAEPNWEPVGIYWESGVSATHARDRPTLMRLVADCRRGMVDLILTKSISRFARNTADCLELVRLLQAMGVVLVFEKEYIQNGGNP